jgi:serine/threonine protein kinase
MRDMGSMNGTYVNGRKFGGRAAGESPEAAMRRAAPEVDLKDGDEIRAGQSVLRVLVKPDEKRAAEAATCGECGAALKPSDGPHLCATCRARGQNDPHPLLVRLVARLGRPEAPARTIAGHTIVRLLDRGGFGAVYLAREPDTKEEVALKVMLAHAAVDESSRRRFAREIETMRAMRHTNIVALRRGGSVGDFFFYTMEYCRGGSLADRLRQRGGTLGLAEAAPIMLDVLAGLSAAHAAGFVHRDVKPGNLLLTAADPTATFKLGDLGLSKRFVSAELNGLTATGMRGGDAHYMPREQLVNFRDTLPVSDVWAAGATFYVMLTGRLPRQGQGTRPLDPLRLVLEGQAVPLREIAPHVPTPIAAVLDRSLQAAPVSRYQSAGEMRAALVEALAVCGVPHQGHRRVPDAGGKR